MFFVFATYRYFIAPVVLNVIVVRLLNSFVPPHLLASIWGWFVMNEVDGVDCYIRWWIRGILVVFICSISDVGGL